MVVALKPGRFYGKALPRPHFYEDVKFNDHRVDPPESVNKALLDWASKAHWSMGGLNFKRSRMQGKIEGRISKLRKQKDESSPPPAKKRLKISSPPSTSPRSSPPSRKRTRSQVEDVRENDALQPSGAHEEEP